MELLVGEEAGGGGGGRGCGCVQKWEIGCECVKDERAVPRERLGEHAKIEGIESVNEKGFQRQFFTVLENLLLKMIFENHLLTLAFKDNFCKIVLQKLNLISKMSPIIFYIDFFEN